MAAVMAPEVDDQWPQGGTLDARKVAAALVAFQPAGLAFYVEEGLPWVEVQYDDGRIAQPGEVVPIGRAIHKAVEKPVLFQALRPNSICFVLDVKPGSVTGNANDPRLPAEEYGVPLEDISKAWQLK